MAIEPEGYASDSAPVLTEESGAPWTPMYKHECTFPSEMFRKVMLNLIRNPNINSNHLFRGDILLDQAYDGKPIADPSLPRLAIMDGFELKTVMVRKLIPRNPLVDKPLDQSCLIYSQSESTQTKSLVVYLPHISASSEAPFYHPAVRGIAFLHDFDSAQGSGVVSTHYSFFPHQEHEEKLDRTAMHLLATLHKHGQGTAAGYVKRVNHDVILPQATVQNTYARLKIKYAKQIITGWVEVTDPTKHVFEDLGIAAFLIELWAEMYPNGDFPGFVDIGCGNGLLVHILLEEGYTGWGFDARRRKSWETYSVKAQENLKEHVLIPSIIQKEGKVFDGNQDELLQALAEGLPGVHSGEFPKGTFIVSNHADELTPWTPILATLSESPFLMIPCCSHNLTGARFRAPPPKDSGSSKSVYNSLVVWVTKLASDCGWEVEKEMLRIPSTRNTALLGRKRKMSNVDIDAIIEEYGGAVGWGENAMKLVRKGPRGH